MRIKFLIILFIAFYIQKNACACTCMTRYNMRDAMTHFDLVISGKIINKEAIIVDTSNEDTSLIKYRIEITEVFKGHCDKNVITIFSDGSSCGYPFQVDKNYIIYSEKHKNSNRRSIPGRKIYFTDWCCPNQYDDVSVRDTLRKLK